MTSEVLPREQRDDVLYKLNKEFVREDAALIKDVAELCGYDYEKSYRALADMFGHSTPSPTTNTSIVPAEFFDTTNTKTTVPSEDQQTVPEMPRLAKSGTDQSVPNGHTFAARLNNAGPKPNSGAIRKTTFNQKQRKPVKEPCNKQHVEKIRRMLSERWLVLVLLRGLPGSGKTYLSKELTDMAEEHGFVYQVCSADHFFQKPNGKYEFNQYDLGRAHEFSQANARRAFNQKTSLVIIDNTNVVDWEMKTYICESVPLGYHIELMEPLTGWRYNTGQLMEKNIHNVPEKSLKNMRERFQAYSVEQLLDQYKLPKINQKVLPTSPAPQQPIQKLPKVENSAQKPPEPKAEPNAKENGCNIVQIVEVDVEQPPAEENQIVSEDEEEIIDYEGVPESAREFYKNLPQLYSHLDPQILRQVFRDNHFDQEYFFDSMENSATYLEKNNFLSSKPLVTPIRKDAPVATMKIVEEVPASPKKAALEPSAELMELKKTLEEKFVIPKQQEPIASKPLTEEKMEADDDEDSQPDSSTSEEDEFDMQLDRNFACNLLLNFGGAYNVEDLEDEALKLKIPASVAMKVFSCWMQAMEKHFDSRQMELKAQLSNDEAIARALAAEQQPVKEENPNMDEILEMERALQAVRNLQIKESKNDLATKMSRTKLLNEFPNMDPTAVENIFEEHNRDYNEAARVIREVYMSDLGAKNVYTPDALKKREEELIEQVKKESLQLLEAAEKKKPLFVDIIPIRQRPTSEQDEAKLIEQITEFRDKAGKARQEKMKSMNGMQNALQKKLHSVAGYYRDLMEQFDAEVHVMNSNVSTLILENSSLVFLDLHYLYVPEALNALDLFLDHHVQRREKDPSVGTEIVQVVTGRGNRSLGGKARLKPAIKERLKKRNIQFEECNPGALRVFINRSLQYSSNYLVEDE